MESKTAPFAEVTFPVQGMSCASCVRHIKASLEKDAGVKAVEVNLAAGEVTVSYNPRTTEPGALADAIQKSGYRPGIPRAE